MTSLDIKQFRNKYNLTQDKLAEILEVGVGTIRSWEQGHRNMTATSVKLLKLYEESITKNYNIVVSDVKAVYGFPFMSVPFIPVSARAGYLRGYGDQEYIDGLSTVPCFVDKNYRGKYRVFEVEGDSMENRSLNEYFLDGDKILCREVVQHLWTSKLHYRDYFFVIVHKTEGILLKEIINHNIDTCDITCHSLNPMFEDFVLNLSEVSELYNVHKLVDRMIRK